MINVAYNHDMREKHKKHIFKMAARIMYLFFIKPADCSSLVKRSYDRISDGYDEIWTNHMRDLTGLLISRLNPNTGDISLDLTCGTGFATNLIVQKTGAIVVGVDNSEGMITQARKNYGNSCKFVQADILKYLKKQPSCSVDTVTCCWGLGYSRPFAVLREIRRVLRKGGKVGIIDNSLFSLREVMYCSFLTFAEQPEKFVNLMRFRFLMNSWHLGLYCLLLGLKPKKLWGGEKSYSVENGKKAIEKLRATGGAAGFEYASNDEDSEEIFDRFAEILEEKYLRSDGITITHRYLAGIAVK